MSKRLEGKVALVSGAARGQGRSHALRLAQEGADIIAFDVCHQLDDVDYPLATPAELKETVARVEALDRRVIAREIDVRDGDAVSALVTDAVAELGRLDVVCANAAVTGFVDNTWSITDAQWQLMIGVNLTGVFTTVRAAVPAMIAAGNGGSIAITSSSAGTKGMVNLGHYSAAKHGVVGLMRTLANELAPHFIRVNTLHPTGVNTPFINNDHIRGFIEAHPTWSTNMQNALPVDQIEPVDVSNAIVWLASDEARYVTGVCLPVDAGFAQR
jgi:(+)-trans-carveol dehydrogenase